MITLTLFASCKLLIIRKKQRKGGCVLEKKEREVGKENQYEKPEMRKHENLKDITLLSFNPPGGGDPS